MLTSSTHIPHIDASILHTNDVGKTQMELLFLQQHSLCNMTISLSKNKYYMINILFYIETSPRIVYNLNNKVYITELYLSP